MFKGLIKRAFGRQYQPLNRVEISSDNLKSNYRAISKICKRIKVAPVLKSNAYGHGLKEVAKALDGVGAPFLCVDSIHEAYTLKKNGIKTKILVMGYVDAKNLKFERVDFSFAAYGIDHFMNLMAVQPNAGIHIFVDTGMGREGISIADLARSIGEIPDKFIGNIEGVMSHFAASEDPGDPRTQAQVANFKKAIGMFLKRGICPKWIHMANSSGLLNCRKLKMDKLTNMARCGIATYGIDPGGTSKKLLPATKLITHVVQVKDVYAGNTVGYGFTYTAKKDIKIAVLPIGYNDGVDRELSNRGMVYIRGSACRIIGRVSMNITVVDVSGLGMVSVGDVAVIDYVIPSKGKIPYEFLIHLNPSIKRVLV